MLSIRLLKAGHPYRTVVLKTGASLNSVVRWDQAFKDSVHGCHAANPRC